MKCAHPKVMVIAIVHSFQLSVTPTHMRHNTITNTQSNVFSMEIINLLIAVAVVFKILRVYEYSVLNRMTNDID